MEEKKNPVDLKRIFQSLQRMPLLFEKTASLEENVRCLAVFLQNFVPVCRVALVLTDTQLRWKDIAVWEQPSLLSSSSFAGWLHKAWQESVESRPGGEGAAELESQLKKSGQAAVFPRYVEKSQTSVLNVLLWKEESCGSWLPKEREMVCLFGELLDKSPSKQQRPGQDVWRSILDSVASSIYITDPDTDKILFMNRTMREAYQIDRPEGKICWQVLQKGEEGRCGFCPVKELMEHRGEPLVLRWEETSPITGRLYENYDSLIPWTDGSLAHFQHSVDVTDSRKMYHVASMDELSGMLSRRAGKEALQKAFLQARFEQVPLTVVMYDLNMLKEVNDVYGHQEGDRLISMTSEEVRRCLGPHDIAFRLSGDEFILALPGRSREEAKHRMNHVLEQLELRRREEGVPYECSFCFGAVEADLSGEFDLTGLLTLADEKMYLQKRRYHIKKREKEFQRGLARPSGHPDEFRYDIRQFYDALVQSTDDYIYVCDMKTDTFRYPKSMVEEFDLPGEVIHNAAAAWAEKIHEHDKQAFLEANQEVADGRAEGHSVEYRAKNRQGEWVWLRCRGHLERDENGEPTLFAGIISNLGKKNRIDHMTGLFNKFEFETDVRRLLERGAQHRMAILILGMDDFRRVNDLYNREFGDEVLRITAQKIQTLLPGNASVYRLDGDEFGVVFQGGRQGTDCPFLCCAEKPFPLPAGVQRKKVLQYTLCGLCLLSTGCAGLSGTDEVCALFSGVLQKQREKPYHLFYQGYFEAQGKIAGAH